MPVVYSTLSSNNSYHLFDTKNPRQPVVKKTVEIKGGAGVMNKRTLETPRGAATLVSADDLKALRENHVFKLHEENGYVFVDEKLAKKPSEDDIEETVDEELTEKDAGAQDTAADYAKKGKKAPKVEKED